MAGFNDRFGGSTLQAAQVAYANLALSANLTLVWPRYAVAAGTYATRIMDVTASVGSLVLTLPDAREVSAGQDMFIVNRGANTFTVNDASGAVITTMVAGQIRYLYLTNNSTAAGVWQNILFGAVTSSIDASSLAGYGLTAISAALAQNTTVTTFSGSTTITNAERARAYVWTGGVGTLTLPLTSAATGFFIEVRNQGSGVLTVAPAGGELIDTSANITLNVNESCFVHAGGGAWYTVGRGRNASFNFTQLTKAVTGGTSTLSLTEAANVVQKYTGVLLSNQTVVVPAIVQVYYISNQTTGAFSFTVQSPTPGTTVSIPTGQNAVLFCDGVNVINCSTTVAGISSIVFAAGSVSNPSVAISTSNTGLYSSGANEVAVTSNGAQVAKFDGSGLLQAPLTGATAIRATSANATADFFADRPAGQIGSVTYRTAGVARWRLAANGTAESGSNAGSDFTIMGYTDAGAGTTYMTMTRSTGNVTFTGTITAAGFTGTASVATNLAGGGAGQVPYQSGAATTAMLAAGTSGQLLRSNGAAPPSWLTPLYAASGANSDITSLSGLTSINSGPISGFRNHMLNGNWDFWQEGAGPWVTTGLYIADQWVHGHLGTTVSATRGSFVSGDALFNPTAGNVAAQYFLVDTITSVANAANFALVQGMMEDVRKLAGQTVTVSFWAKAASGTPTIGVGMTQDFGAGGAPTADASVAGQSQALTTTWTKYSKTFAVPSLSGITLGTTPNTSYTTVDFWLDAGANFNTRSGSCGQASKTVSIAQVQVEIGSVASMYTARPRAIELVELQRFFEKSYAQDTDPGTVTTNGQSIAQRASTTATDNFPVPFKVTKRAQATCVIYSPSTGASGNLRASAGVDRAATLSGGENAGSVNCTGIVVGETSTWHWTAASRL